MKEVIISMTLFFNALNNIETPAGMPIPYPAHNIGQYQISYDYWLDSGMEGEWADCLDEEYSKQVMIRYWLRYAPQALKNRNYPVLARIHYGGPNGNKKESTYFYWLLVSNEMYPKKLNRSYQ